MTEETVTVPRELLREVLSKMDDQLSAALAFAKDERHLHAMSSIRTMRARIAELRRIAGLEDASHG